MVVGIALLGAGIFGREEYLPAINASSRVVLKAIYSRSQKSAEALATGCKTQPDTYYSSPSLPGKELDDLLKRTDIDAVIICLPITVQPEVIRKALALGKHVLSEKPISKDLKTAEDLINYHKKLSLPPIWAVAESHRVLDPFTLAAYKLKEIGGQLLTFSMRQYGSVKTEDKYFQTEWRKNPDYQGGFLLDGGIHSVAGLRHLLNAVGHEVSELSAYTGLLDEKLHPADTINAIWTTDKGRSGSFNMSFGTEFKSALEFEVVTTTGRVSCDWSSVTASQKDSEGKDIEFKKQFSPSSGARLEVDAFGASVEAGNVDPASTPQEALMDLCVMQHMLVSGEENGALKKVI